MANEALREALTIALNSMHYADRLGHIACRQSDFDQLRAILANLEEKNQ